MMMNNKSENHIWNYLKGPWNNKLSQSDVYLHAGDLVKTNTTNSNLVQCEQRFVHTFGEQE